MRNPKFQVALAILSKSFGKRTPAKRAIIHEKRAAREDDDLRDTIHRFEHFVKLLFAHLDYGRRAGFHDHGSERFE